MGKGHNEPSVYSVDAAAQRVGICRDGIYSAIREKRLKAKKYGRRTLITEADLQAFLNELPDLNLDRVGANSPSS